MRQFHHSRKREDGFETLHPPFLLVMEVHEALADYVGRRLARDGSALVHVHMLEAQTVSESIWVMKVLMCLGSVDTHKV